MYEVPDFPAGAHLGKQVNYGSFETQNAECYVNTKSTRNMVESLVQPY